MASLTLAEVLQLLDQRQSLAETNLSHLDLSDLDLRRTNLVRTNLIGADLSGAHLNNANLTLARLENANLTNANLSSANLERANLDGANLTGANLRKANLRSAILHNATLENAKLQNAILVGADFSEANLNRANLTGTDLGNANISREQLSSVIMASKYNKSADPYQNLLPPISRELPEAPLDASTDWQANEEAKIQFSVFYPFEIRPDALNVLYVFAHTEPISTYLRALISGDEAMTGEGIASGTIQKNTSVDIGDVLTFVPVIDNVTFMPPAQGIVWQSPEQHVRFFFQAAPEARKNIPGHIQVYQGPLILGEIPIIMRLLGGSTSKVPQASVHVESMQRFDPVFASYSHRDMPVMEYFRKTKQKLGQTMLADIHDLRSGDMWSERLMKMIEESAAFQLFWSKNSANSQYCRQEWQHALHSRNRRSRFIQPVWWKEPFVTPPNELQDFHFARIYLPLGTKFKVKLAEINTLFWKK